MLLNPFLIPVHMGLFSLFQREVPLYRKKPLILIGTIAIILIALVGLGIFNAPEQYALPANLEGDISINGEIIAKEDIDTLYTSLSQQENTEDTFTKADIVQGLIDQILLLQEAREKEVTIEDEEIESFITQLLALEGTTEEDLSLLLLESGATLDEYKAGIKEQMIVSKLLNDELDLENMKATEADIDAFIEENGGFGDIFGENNPDLTEQFERTLQQRITLKKQQDSINNFLIPLRQQATIAVLTT